MIFFIPGGKFQFSLNNLRNLTAFSGINLIEKSCKIGFLKRKAFIKLLNVESSFPPPGFILLLSI